ncbi:MAG: VTT domain-containing protein [Phototrophicaceae bacterium]
MQDVSFTKKLWQYRSQLLTLAIWLLIGISVNVYMQINNLSFIEFADEMGHLLADNWYGPLLYIILYVLRPLTFFPGTPMTMLAGYIYGIGWGFVYGMIAGLLSTALPYIIGRWFSDEEQLTKMVSERNTRIAALIGMMQDNPFQTVLTTRFLYFPYDLVNFAAGSLHIPFGAFIAATAIGNTVNAFIIVSIGASLEASLAEGTFMIDPILILFSMLIWLISYSINRYLKHKNKEILST